MATRKKRNHVNQDLRETQPNLPNIQSETETEVQVRRLIGNLSATVFYVRQSQRLAHAIARSNSATPVMEELMSSELWAMANLTMSMLGLLRMLTCTSEVSSKILDVEPKASQFFDDCLRLLAMEFKEQR